MASAPDTATAAPAVKPLACPNCGGTTEIRAAGYTVTLICPYCSSVLDVANPDVAIIERYNEATAELDIPLGERGTLKGVEWEAIGYIRRSEGGEYPWEEYLLFNPYRGYRWLVTDGRGWSLGTMLTASPAARGDVLNVDGQTYKPFFREGRAQVDYVLGEFYWRVKAGEEVATADWVRPGFMLSMEADASERNWTLSELLDPKEMQAAFGVERPKPWRPGGPPPLAHQPSPYAKSLGAFVKLGAVAALALIVLVFIFGGTGPKQSFDMTIVPGSAARTATFGPVNLTRATQGVTISAEAPGLNNAWVDLDYALVDRKTQTAFEAYAVAERYTGRDSDGDWSEGSRDAVTKLATVPAGSYDLVVDASGQNWGFNGQTGEIKLVVSIAQGATFLSNILLALIAISIPLLWVLWRHARFETARTAESSDGSALAEMMENDEDDD